MTTEEIRELRLKIVVNAVATAQRPGVALVALSRPELDYLAGLIRSHILWREWLVPDE